MATTFMSRLKHAWNVFVGNNKDPTYEVGNSYRPDRVYYSRTNEGSIITSIYTRIALDVASLTIQHVYTDDDGRFTSIKNSGLNACFNLEANIDQTGRAFLQDIVMSMLDEGCVAIVPVDTDIDPLDSNSFDIETMRTGRITEWFPHNIRALVFNEQKGFKEEVVVPKRMVGIVENPFYAIMNERNATAQRLKRKLMLLDRMDEAASSSKLDLIIQLPYTVRNEITRKRAEERRKSIEDQLANSKYGIAYADGTERIVQLNRPVDNTLMSQIEYLTNMLFSQLCMTQSILDGTADDQTMENYFNRTIEPIASAIVDELKRKFLTKTARTQNQTVMFFRDPFKLAPLNTIAEVSDKLSRNEIMTSNEIRQKIGMRPSDDPRADKLRNKNINSNATEEVKNQNEERETV